MFGNNKLISRYSLLGIGFGTYVFASVLLLKKPGILHKKKNRHFYCSHISHRGGAAERPENTIAAFNHAVEAETQMLELDVQMTKDKVAVVFHDENLKRCTGNCRNIDDLIYEELPSLKLDEWSSLQREQSEAERIPTLEEVFARFPSVPINLDIKGKGSELLEEISRLIKKYDREEITLWGCYDVPNPSTFTKLNPDVPVFFSGRRQVLLYVWFYLGLLPFIPLKETHLQTALPESVQHSGFETTRIRRLFLKYFGLFLKNRALFEHLKDRGISTYLWVVNEEKDFETAFKLGAEGVMTDCPTKLTQWLNEHPQYKNFERLRLHDASPSLGISKNDLIRIIANKNCSVQRKS